MFKCIYTIFFLFLFNQVGYSSECCEKLVEITIDELKNNSRFSALNRIIENVDCFSSYNIDSILYVNLCYEYESRNYNELKTYLEKTYSRKKTKEISTLEILSIYRLERYNEALLLINSFNELHEHYFPVEILRSMIFRDKGEFQISNNYLKTIKPRRYKDFMMIQIDRANNFMALKENEKSKEIYCELINSGKSSNFKSFYFSYANYQVIEKDYTNALETYNQYLVLNSKFKDEFSALNHGRVFTNMMQCYGLLNNELILSYRDSAYLYKYRYLQKNIDMEYSPIHQNLSEYYILNNDYSKANKHIDSSILHHLYYLSDNPIEDLFKNKLNYKLIHDKVGLLGYLDTKYKILKSDNSNEQIDNIFKVIDNLIIAIKKENYGIQSKLFSQDTLSNYYQKAFLYYINKNQLNKAIQFSQKLKGTILLESLDHSEATDILEPEQRDEYLNLLYERNKLISELIHNSSKDSLVRLLSENLKNQEELEQFIQQKTPEFFNRIYTNKSFKIKDIQQALSPKEMMLDYVILQDTLYQLSITKKSIQAKKKHLTIYDFEELKSIKQLISKPPSIDQWGSKEAKELKIRLSSLADKLLFPIDHEYSQIIIIAHAELKKFPFIALTDSKDDYSYIVQSKQIYYAPNIALWLKNQNNSINFNQILIVDPFSQDENSEDYLPYARYEVQRINQYFPSKRVDSASISDLKNFSIVHFLMHSIINDNNPMRSYLKLNNDSLSLSLENIKHARISNDLVFISSCESNSGFLSKNEGIISLSRSFLEAGTKSVVATYWPIDDYASSQIASSFYSNLREYDVSTSLQKAQNTYLSNAGYYESHPFFWAAFHPNGINIKNKSYKWSYLLYGLVFVIPIGYFFVRYILNRNA